MKDGILLGLIFSLFLGAIEGSWNRAQAQANAGQSSNYSDGKEVKKSGPRRQLATIVFAGLGGAVLGLSTLSFYGRPQDYLVNIAIGFAVGVIAGTAYVTFQTVSTKDYYDSGEPKEKKGAQINVSPFITESPLTSKLDGGGAKLTLTF